MKMLLKKKFVPASVRPQQGQFSNLVRRGRRRRSTYQFLGSLELEALAIKNLQLKAEFMNNVFLGDKNFSPSV